DGIGCAPGGKARGLALEQGQDPPRHCGAVEWLRARADLRQMRVDESRVELAGAEAFRAHKPREERGIAARTGDTRLVKRNGEPVERLVTRSPMRDQL